MTHLSRDDKLWLNKISTCICDFPSGVISNVGFIYIIGPGIQTLIWLNCCLLMLFLRSRKLFHAQNENNTFTHPSMLSKLYFLRIYLICAKLAILSRNNIDGIDRFGSASCDYLKWQPYQYVVWRIILNIVVKKWI